MHMFGMPPQSKDVRDNFRRFRYKAPDKFDYKRAQIPSALTPEVRAADGEPPFHHFVLLLLLQCSCACTALF